MDVILKVVEGAKTGAKIAVKKNEFVIGRSPECHLCAGSSAVSRRHCAILRHENRVTVKDLGSRNGTLVNGMRISEEVELASGDELVVGPLKFMVTITAGIANVKRAEVKSVAEAVNRAAKTSPADIGDDEISRWLLAPDTSALNETQTIRIDDTNAVHVGRPLALDADTAAMDLPDEDDAAETADTQRGKRAPGKLPKMAQKPTSKDSREAAAEALRAWSRRR
jgi:pSer/pThr/pTyr-binding forkhead associated (FHA) protein